jgi:diguanylate cyclase (GGDEF)-like protein
MSKKLINLLLVDDDPADRKLTEFALRGGLYNVDFAIKTAETLANCIHSMQNDNIDLVLLDLGLPESKGIPTVEKVRQTCPNIPIIVLTGLLDEEIGVEAIKRGAIDYVTKPFNQTGLRTRIGIALQIIELQQKLLQLANTDGLTDLTNRRHFFDILDREVLRAKISGSDLSVMMLDIDHFKSANDSYGHRGGDDILRQMGQILKENIYPLDVVARYGGEEFIILMPSTTPVKAAQAAARLRKVIDQYQWKVGETKISITASIGLASVDSYNLVNSYDIVEKADAALYAAKRRGRNCVVCWDEVNGEQDIDQPPDNRVYKELQNKVSTLVRQLQAYAVGTISALTRAMDMVVKEPYLHIHGENVKKYAVEIARELGLSDELCEHIAIAALLQDFGKIGVPEQILKNPNPLTEEEIQIIRQHPMAAAKILEPIGLFSLELQVIKYHHERFDGKGYPSGLKGKEIPIGARILALADAVDAMTSEHNYKKPKSFSEALAEVNACSGTQFDPEVVNAFAKASLKHTTDWPLSNCALNAQPAETSA